MEGGDSRSMINIRVMDTESGVPICIYWNVEQVVDWFDQIGYSVYKPCLERNHVTGRFLITLDASKLPDLGIHDFEHIKDIAQKIRDLLGITKIYRDNSEMTDPMVSYMYMKSRTGERAANLIYTQHKYKLAKWLKNPGSVRFQANY